jgi:hypothetical protein
MRIVGRAAFGVGLSSDDSQIGNTMPAGMFQEIAHFLNARFRVGQSGVMFNMFISRLGANKIEFVFRYVSDLDMHELTVLFKSVHSDHRLDCRTSGIYRRFDTDRIDGTKAADP